MEHESEEDRDVDQDMEDVDKIWGKWLWEAGEGCLVREWNGKKSTNFKLILGCEFNKWKEDWTFMSEIEIFVEHIWRKIIF